MKQLIQDARLPDTLGAFVVYEHPLDERPLWVGLAATETLRRRWRVDDLYARCGGDRLRRALAAFLDLTDDASAPLAPEVEVQVTAFLATCWIEVLPTETREEAQATQARWIDSSKPLLEPARAAAK